MSDLSAKLVFSAAEVPRGVKAGKREFAAADLAGLTF
jgi:hypothetical protein